MKKLVLAVAAISVLSLSACGGSDEDANAPLSKAEFVKQAQAICGKGEKAIDDAAKSLGDSPDMRAIKKFVRTTVVPETRKTVDELDALEAPEDLAAKFDKMLASINSELDKVDKDPGYGLSDKAFTQANRLAVEMGLPACGA